MKRKTNEEQGPSKKKKHECPLEKLTFRLTFLTTKPKDVSKWDENDYNKLYSRTHGKDYKEKDCLVDGCKNKLAKLKLLDYEYDLNFLNL